MKYIKIFFVLSFIFAQSYILADNKKSDVIESQQMPVMEDGTENPEGDGTTVLEREGYIVRLKKYAPQYPLVLYVVFKEFTPLRSEIQKILKTELLTVSKTYPFAESSKDTDKSKAVKSDKSDKKQDKTDTKSEEEQNQENTTIIASAWFDDQVSDELEKVELSTSNSAFVWVNDEEKENSIMSFQEYIKYLKEKMKKDRLEDDMQSEESQDDLSVSVD